MESGNRKIYRLRVFLLFAIVLFTGSALLSQRRDGAKFSAEKIRIPIYQEGRDHPILILYSAAAKPIGLRFEMKGVKLDWLGDAISDIKGTVETPTAIYDQSTKTVTGNEKVTYRSKEIDINGLGFDIDQVKQVIHIRSKVEVILKGDLTSTKQRRDSKNKAKKKKNKGGALSLVPTTEKGKASENQNSASKLKQLLNGITVKKPNVKEKEK